jgi:hypothetical protein
LKKCTRWSVAVGTGLTLTLGFVSPAMAAVGTAPAAATSTSTPTKASSGVQLPANWQALRDAAAARTGLETSPATKAVGRAINPGDYACGPTDLDAYVDNLLSGLGNADLQFLFTSGVLDFPTYDALFFGTSADPQYALASGHRQELTNSFRDAKKFWDIQSGDIQLMAMHGDGVLQDSARLTRLLTVVYGLSAPAAEAYAKGVVATVAKIPALKGGNNPIFTLNAFAFSGKGDSDPQVAALPDKLIFGDGILDALEYMHVGDVGPRAVLGHEFGHHVQYEDNLFDSPLTGPEATRRTELMADAFGTYFATHSRGLALNAKRVLQAEKTFYEVGDCAFDNAGHHGTPNQRVRASQWGANLASSAQKQGHILPSLTVAASFDKALPELVKPDAS